MRILPLGKKIDGYLIKVPIYNLEDFSNRHLGRIFSESKKINPEAFFIQENPGYPEFEEYINNNPATSFWACNHLRSGKNLDVSIPETCKQNPKDTLVDFYLFTSKKALNKLNFYFFSFASRAISTVDFWRAAIQGKKLKYRENDQFALDAKTFFIEHEMNRIDKKRFQKKIKNMNIKEIRYKKTTVAQKPEKTE